VHRSGVFIREGPAPAEKRLLAAHPGWDRAHVTSLVWTANERAAEVRRERLRLDVLRAVVAPADAGAMTTAGKPAPSRPKGAP
jgi:hypothetical protein